MPAPPDRASRLLARVRGRRLVLAATARGDAGLVRLVPSHGDIVASDAKDVLDAAAHRLAGL